MWIASYGLWPGPALEGTLDLRPALALKARVNMVKFVAAGEALSWRAESTSSTRRAGWSPSPPGTRMGTTGGRRASPTFSSAGNATGSRAPCAWISSWSTWGDHELEPGHVVTLIGQDGDESVSAEALAEHIGTINYEVTTRIPSRVPRIYLNEEDD